MTESMACVSTPRLNPTDSLPLIDRLWHQLTLTLEKFYENSLSPPFHVDLFNNFVLDFESKLNPLRLVELGVRASKQIDGDYRVCAMYRFGPTNGLLE